MRMQSSAILALSLIVAVAPQAGAQEPDTRPGVAVLPFEDGGWKDIATEDRAALAVGLQQFLLNELQQNTSLRIVERSALRQVLEELDLGTSGRVDAETAARIGQIVGARYVVLGTFTDLGGSQPMLTGRIVSVETTEVLRGEQSLGKHDDLYRMVVDLAGRVTSGVNLPALPAPVREQRREREIPPEAMRLFSHAQVMQDLGRTEQAIELYRQITDRFPAMTEASEALRQLQSD